MVTAVSEDFPRNNDQAAIRFNACVLVSSDPASSCSVSVPSAIEFVSSSRTVAVIIADPKCPVLKKKVAFVLNCCIFITLKKKYYPTTEMKQSNITRRDKLTHTVTMLYFNSILFQHSFGNKAIIIIYCKHHSNIVLQC